MTNNNKWIDELRKKMESHQEAPPEGLWEDIAKSLSQTRACPTADDEKKDVAKHTVFGRRWWVAAAAIILMLIGGGMLYWMANQQQGDNSSEMIAKNEANPTETEQQNDSSDNRIIEDSEHSSESEQSNHSSTHGHSSPLDLPNNTSNLSLSGESGLSNNDLAISEVANDLNVSNNPINKFDNNSSKNPGNNQSDNPSNNPSNNSSNNPSNNSGVSDNPIVSSERNIIAELDREFASERSQGQKIAIGLYAANDIQGISNKANVVDYAMSNTYMGDVYGDYSLSSMRKMVLQDYYEKKHHYQPVSAGLTAKIGLTDRVAITTGVVYTLLRSDFTTNVGSSSIDRKQTLHYLGVPVALMYKLWESGGFSSYVSVGGEADYNIAARMTTEGDKVQINRDKLQWSAIASVGAQYDFSPYVGLYFEPGVKYYFDNGSDIVNVFKDKKTNFNVQFGLRFNIK